MSDFRAIGGVSATLRNLLFDRMEFPAGLGQVPITVGPPAFSAKDSEPHKEGARVNLFLYRVSENGALQNQEIPGRGAASGYGHPPLSLNLHYLLTAYGNSEVPGGNGTPLFDETTAQHLLGSAMRVLHDISTVTTRLTSVRPPGGQVILHESLRDTYERVRLSLEPLTLEDITKVWTALALRYRLSAAYAVNVVQIESTRPRSFPRPVGPPTNPTVAPPPDDYSSAGPHVRAVTLQSPTIVSVAVRRGAAGVEQPYAHARIGDTLVLRGTALAGGVTTAVFGDVHVTVSPDTVRPDRVEVVLPDDAGLQPGVRGVKIVTSEPDSPGISFYSNEAAFVLVPSVTAAAVTHDPGVAASLTVDGIRLLSTEPGGEVMLGRAVVTRSSYRNAAPTKLTVTVPNTLPAHEVPVVLGEPLTDPVVFGDHRQAVTITLNGNHFEATTALTATTPRSQLAPAVQAMIRNAGPNDPVLASAIVRLAGDRLVVLPGDLTSALEIASPADSTLAADLGLTAAPVPGAAVATISGALPAQSVLSARNPAVRIQVGAAAPLEVALGPDHSLAALAAAMQTALAASAVPGYQDATALAATDRVILVPGTAERLTVLPAQDDPTSATELQLHGMFGVRVRVNGADSVDEVLVELPR